MRSFGKFLQLAGLVALPLAMLLQWMPGDSKDGTVISVGQMLMMLVAGACLFWIGRILEGYSK
ncbi:MAG: hypothetical protein MPJ50_17905 [Pirellulales bacterium]|nr:hypothetical protein [Pirellulales bacterium]